MVNTYIHMYIHAVGNKEGPGDLTAPITPVMQTILPLRTYCQIHINAASKGRSRPASPFHISR